MKQDSYIIYEIRIHGTLPHHWESWFEGYTLIDLGNGDTLLRGPMRDQSELRGMLEKIANLNLQLVSVNPSDP